MAAALPEGAVSWETDEDDLEEAFGGEFDVNPVIGSGNRYADCLEDNEPLIRKVLEEIAGAA